MHTAIRPAVIAVVGIIAVGTSAPGVLASASPPASASIHAQLRPLKAGLAVLVTKQTVIPQVQRTVGFNGYATYTFSAPRGRRIVSASARIAGAQAHAVVIRRRTISHHRTRYIVSLVFPGEQGNPGKLIVRLATTG
jgi:hypothetical protein